MIEKQGKVQIIDTTFVHELAKQQSWTSTGVNKMLKIHKYKQFARVCLFGALFGFLVVILKRAHDYERNKEGTMTSAGGHHHGNDAQVLFKLVPITIGAKIVLRTELLLVIQ